MFQKELDKMIRYEITNSTFSIPRAADNKIAALGQETGLDTLSVHPDLVLTTTGTAYGAAFPAKRLYSSLRLRPPPVSGSLGQLKPLDLERLPHGITAAAVRPERGYIGDVVKAPTLSGLFPPSRHLKHLEPPRPSSNAATRGQTITWSHPESTTRSPRSGGRVSYYNQTLSSGHWLSYCANLPASQHPSTGEKRKQRDRALSTGEANAELTEEEQEELRQAKEARQRAEDEALFKNVYSSFAPTHDDTAAIVPQHIKSRLWWDKYGLAKPLRYFTEYEEIEDDQILPLLEEVEDKAAEFEAMVKNWEDVDGKPPYPMGDAETEGSKMEKDVDSLLQDVSDMIETLSSYQRIRSISSGTKQQGSTTQNKSLIELTGDPANPSNAESVLYDALKSQLSFIISSLPPYAVARLDGNKLDALNISPMVVTKTPIHRGTLRAPEPAKPTALNTSTTSVTRPQTVLNSRGGSYQQPVSTPTNRTNLASTRPPTASYTANTSSRTPSSTVAQNNASYLAQQQLGQQRPQSVSYSQYGQTPSAAKAPLTNGTRPLTNGYSAYSQQHSSTSGSPNASRTSSSHSQFSRPAQPSYQQRPPSSSAATTTAQQQTYSTYNINMHRGNSPQKGASTPINPVATQGPQRPGSNPAATTPIQSPSTAAAATRPNWFPSDGTIGSMFSAEEVQTLEQRQKLQMAAQHAQLRQGSGTPGSTGTPQPAVPRPSSHQSNGTPVPAPAATPAAATVETQNGDVSMT